MKFSRYLLLSTAVLMLGSNSVSAQLNLGKIIQNSLQKKSPGGSSRSTTSSNKKSSGLNPGHLIGGLNRNQVSNTLGRPGVQPAVQPPAFGIGKKSGLQLGLTNQNEPGLGIRRGNANVNLDSQGGVGIGVDKKRGGIGLGINGGVGQSNNGQGVGISDGRGVGIGIGENGGQGAVVAASESARTPPLSECSIAAGGSKHKGSETEGDRLEQVTCARHCLSFLHRSEAIRTCFLLRGDTRLYAQLFNR